MVGDIVHLSIGDQVPADGVVTESNSLTVDESQMTGESEPKKKGPDEPFLMSGCKIADGGGKMMIVAVGMNTEWGRLMSTLSSDDTEETPLQVRRLEWKGRLFRESSTSCEAISDLFESSQCSETKLLHFQIENDVQRDRTRKQMCEPSRKGGRVFTSRAAQSKVGQFVRRGWDLHRTSDRDPPFRFSRSSFCI